MREKIGIGFASLAVAMFSIAIVAALNPSEDEGAFPEQGLLVDEPRTFEDLSLETRDEFAPTAPPTPLATPARTTAPRTTPRPTAAVPAAPAAPQPVANTPAPTPDPTPTRDPNRPRLTEEPGGDGCPGGAGGGGGGEPDGC